VNAGSALAEPGLRRIDAVLWEIPASVRADMRVPARVFADEEILDAIKEDRSLEQLQNVATLPGIVGAALAMPDVHQGYGFPVGGVAATAPPDGVISPGGVGSGAEELDRVLVDGARALVERHGIGTSENLDRTRVAGQVGGGGPGYGLAPRQAARRRPARDDGLRQPFRRGAEG
jgi:tRNA-splicing ligase RtcB